MNNPKFQIYIDNKGEYRYRLKAKNGENILHSSEGYTSKQNCKNAIESVKLNASYDSRYKRGTATNGQFYFVLKASNGEALGMSEMYNTIYSRDNGIEAVKRDAPAAPVEDLTITRQSSYYRY